MTMSSPAAPGPSGFITEPPLSPCTAPISPAPAPVSQLPSRPTTPSIEAQVVRLGLMTPDQVATAMREEAETGRTFDEIVIAHAEPARATQILENPFYQALSSSFAGTQEYMAMEKLGQLRQTGDWDLIVVDTPPSRSVSSRRGRRVARGW